MLAVAPFMPADLLLIDLQRSQEQWLGVATAPRNYELGMALSVSGPCWTAFDGTRPIICAGLAEQWQGHAVAWAYVAAGARPFIAELTEIVSVRLAASRFHRIETMVRSDRRAHRRFAERSGLTREGTLAAYGPEGIDHDCYALVRRELVTGAA